MYQGLIEAAVLTGSNEEGPLPVLAESVSEIIACASSKFGATATLEALNRAVAVGRSNLGVVGTPCQITAVAKMRSNPLGRDDFVDPISLVIGLFCNWSLDQRLIKAYLSNLVDVSRIKRIDIPPPPANVLRVDLGDEALEISLDEVRGFIPDTCGLCHDMTSEWADLSVGMYEGRTGWNTVLVRTAKGRELVQDAIESGMLIASPMPAENIKHLTEAAAGKKQRAFQALRQRGLVNCTDEAKRAVLRVSDTALNRIITAHNGGGYV
jgi:coenzyme F420 hydrogenase subunit beta